MEAATPVKDSMEASGEQVKYDWRSDFLDNFTFVTNGQINHDALDALNLIGINGGNESNDANGSEYSVSSIEDGVSTETDSDAGVPFIIYVDLGPDFPVNDIWFVIDEARRHILRRIRRNSYGHGPLDVVNSNVLLFEGELPAHGLSMVDGASELEYIHRHLENWLFILLDLEVQDYPMEIPFSAGRWHMAWCRRWHF